MTLISTTLPAVVVAGGLAAAVLGLGTAPASAEPAPPPAPASADPPVVPPASDPPPAAAPPKPAEFWDGLPVVWNSDWAGRWGVWTKDGFIDLSPDSTR